MGLFGRMKEAAKDAVNSKVEEGRAVVREKASGTKIGGMAVGAIDGARAKRDENLMDGPHDVSVFVAVPSALAKVKRGKSVRMTVLPNKVLFRFSENRDGVIYENDRVVQDDEVTLAYDGRPCAVMRDATGTLATAAKTRPVELTVTHGTNYLGNDEWTARWYSYDPAERDRERAERFADEDARSVWVNIQADKWEYARPMDRETVKPLTMVQSGEGKPTLTFADGDGVVMFSITSRMKAYNELQPHLGAPLEKALVLKRDGEYGEFYRVKIVFAE